MNQTKRKIVIPGGSGFLGQTLAQYFEARGDGVVILSRGSRPLRWGRNVHWDGENLGEWCKELESADAVINLAGRSVNCRYHDRNRKQMMDSRVLSTRILGQAIRQCDSPPKLWLQSSTATIYLHRYDAPNDEATGKIGSHPDAKDEFSIQVAQGWEAAFETEATPNTRRIVMRTAMVFGPQPGGVFHVLRNLARLGLGGTMGDGKQYVSWLHADDWCGIIEWFMYNETASGTYNLCAPNPLPNHEMMHAMRQASGAPLGFGLPQPHWMLEFGAWLIRTETELIIKSRRVIPQRLQDEGYVFRFETFDPMMRSMSVPHH
ncbi:MAG: TIGR01777 family oxidoreductase [Verrucomicrobiota bacterium]